MNIHTLCSKKIKEYSILFCILVGAACQIDASEKNKRCTTIPVGRSATYIICKSRTKPYVSNVHPPVRHEQHVDVRGCKVVTTHYSNGGRSTFISCPPPARKPAAVPVKKPAPVQRPPTIVRKNK